MRSVQVESDPVGHLRNIQNRARSIPRRDAIAELIDNSIDWNSTYVVVTISDEIKIVDDGDGCASHDRMFTLALGYYGEGVKTGRFGQGLKAAAMRLGNTLRVVTMTAEDGGFSAVMDWQEHIDSGRSKGFDVGPLSTGPTGTTVRIGDARRWSPREIENLRKELGWTYLPALAKGRTIIVNGDDVHAALPPTMVESRTVTVKFSGGRTMTAVGGILDEEAARPAGIELFYETRHICHLPSPSSRFFVQAVIIDGRHKQWQLSMHKNSLASPDERGEILGAIGQEFSDLIKRASEQPITIDGISLAMRGKKSVRAGGEKSDPHERNGKGSTKPEAKRPGGKRRKRGGFKIERGQWPEPARLGEVTDALVVRVNENNRGIKQALDAGERGKWFLTVVGVFLLADYGSSSDDIAVRERILGTYGDEYLHDADYLGAGNMIDGWRP